jgi:hypothetical protein
MGTHSVLIYSDGYGFVWASCLCGWSVRSVFGPVIDRAAAEHSAVAVFAA